MKKLRTITCLAFLTIPVFFSCSGQSKHQKRELKIILIRHGEKPENGDNLSCAGLNRSIKLPAVIKNKFGVPDYIYVPAPNTGKRTNNVRMLQTVTPLSA